MTANIQDRKLQVIHKLATLQNEQLLQLIESFLFDEADSPDDEPLSDSEKELLRERIAHYHANPDDEIPWESVKKELTNRRGLRS